MLNERACEDGKQWIGDDGWCGHRARDSSKTCFRNQKKASGTLRAIETKRALTAPLDLSHAQNKTENPLLERDAMSSEKVSFQVSLVSGRAGGELSEDTGEGGRLLIKPLTQTF